MSKRMHTTITDSHMQDMGPILYKWKINKNFKSSHQAYSNSIALHIELPSNNNCNNNFNINL
jgi:hypothetical protein